MKEAEAGATSPSCTRKKHGFGLNCIPPWVTSPLAVAARARSGSLLLGFRPRPSVRPFV